MSRALRVDVVSRYGVRGVDAERCSALTRTSPGARRIKKLNLAAGRSQEAVIRAVRVELRFLINDLTSFGGYYSWIFVSWVNTDFQPPLCQTSTSVCCSVTSKGFPPRVPDVFTLAVITATFP